MADPEPGQMSHKSVKAPTWDLAGRAGRPMKDLPVQLQASRCSEVNKEKPCKVQRLSLSQELPKANTFGLFASADA